MINIMEKIMRAVTKLEYLAMENPLMGDAIKMRVKENSLGCTEIPLTPTFIRLLTPLLPELPEKELKEIWEDVETASEESKESLSSGVIGGYAPVNLEIAYSCTYDIVGTLPGYGSTSLALGIDNELPDSLQELIQDAEGSIGTRIPQSELENLVKDWASDATSEDLEYIFGEPMDYLDPSDSTGEIDDVSYELNIDSIDIEI